METKSTQPKSSTATAKPKPVVHKLIDGKLVPYEEGEIAGLNHDEVRRALRDMRTKRKKNQHQGPKKRPKPHAKKWNSDARRHLERYINSVERRANTLKAKKEAEERAA